ncbi:hypothetical protein CN931_25170 [Bacillus sp. AFS054943]|uniref:Helicase HerA central domain-containing protein n=1 Tax=Bacillus cereus TaxID=1396 RepID=A0A2C1LLY0_BACCE|nr:MULTISPECIES: DUF87 domain-containing protein [Bacillus]MBE7123421.1 hypothetical protein [Bacillus cereus]PGL77246.1 hypothetical protein CN931_25170 [Bacillus sp. AFS054943]PGT99487.1 hypothetical protein COD19_19410 [Bacillus cereus]TKI39098.1 hypothetical protein FC700_21820 [Bacillus mycoides]
MGILKLFKKNEEIIDDIEVAEDEINEEQIERSQNVKTQLENKSSLWDVISPDGIVIDHEDHGRIKQTLGEETFFRPFYVPRSGYPRKLQTNWLSSILNAGEIDITLDIHKEQKSQAMRALDTQLTMLESNYDYQTKKGNVDQKKDLEVKIGDTNALMNELQFDENDTYQVSVMGIAYASSKKELDTVSHKIEDTLATKFMKVSSTWNRVKSGFKAVLPFGMHNNLHDTYRNIDRRALSTFSPFISASGIFNDGIPIGENKLTRQIEFLNSFGNEDYRPPNYNLGVTGIPGSGKSLFLKMKLAREAALANTYAAVIDPEGEFTRVTKRLNGINLNINPESNIVINPFSMSPTELELNDEDEELEALENYDKKELFTRDGKKFVRFVPILQKINELIGFFDMIVMGDGNTDARLDVYERSSLEEVIKEIFDEHQITSHPASLYSEELKKVDGQLIQAQVRKPEPELKEVYDKLVKLQEKEKEKSKVDRLVAAIRPFLRDGSKPIFDGQNYFGPGVSMDLDNARVINFNITQLEESYLRPVAFYVILNFIWEHWIKNPANALKRKKLYIDELWQFVDHEQTVDFIEKCSRRARKRNCGVCWASQDFMRILNSPKAQGVLTTTYSYFFFQQHHILKDKVQKHFGLSDGEIDIIVNNPLPGEGIYRVGENSVWIRTNPSPNEMIFLESNEAVLQDTLKKMQNDSHLI